MCLGLRLGLQYFVIGSLLNTKEKLIELRAIYFQMIFLMKVIFRDIRFLLEEYLLIFNLQLLRT